MPYRDELDALVARHKALREDLEAIRKRARELESEKQREAQIEREVEEIARQIEAMNPRRALPLLENIQIASPCNADWNSMSGDERVRFCGDCRKQVYNLSGMSADEAEALLREKEGDLCARLYRRADGTVLTTDCPEGNPTVWAPGPPTTGMVSPELLEKMRSGEMIGKVEPRRNIGLIIAFFLFLLALLTTALFFLHRA